MENLSAKRIFICSPYSGTKEEIANNVRIAQSLCRIAIDKGHHPFAPHLLYPQFLVDTDEKQRAAGIDAGLSFMNVCDEVWVYVRKGFTSGMRKEMTYAHERGKRIVFVDFDCVNRSTFFSMS